jgi:hypothetical protein
MAQSMGLKSELNFHAIQQFYHDKLMASSPKKRKINESIVEDDMTSFISPCKLSSVQSSSS